VSAITIVGGGVFVASLCQLLAATPGIEPKAIRLVARRYDRLRVIAESCQRILQKAGYGWTVTAFPSLNEACSGADMIVLMLRAGGFEARSRDESFPRAFGLPGDEGLGPGGISNALRTTMCLAPIADAIARSAPSALVLNLVAPLGVTTRYLLERGLDVIGLCELPATTERRLATAASYSGMKLHYAGFNHLGFFWPDTATAAVLADTSVESGLTDRETVEHFEAVPLRYYFEIFAPMKAEVLGFRRSATRARDLQNLSEEVFAAMSRGEDPGECLSARLTPWFDHVVMPFFASHPEVEYEGFANVRNGARFSMLPADVVVELRVKIKCAATETCVPSEPPARVSAFLSAVGQSEDLVYRACMTEDQNERACLVRDALRCLPITRLPERLDLLVEEIVRAAGV
jgi:6-phospho-beta-glucosidase